MGEVPETNTVWPLGVELTEILFFFFLIMQRGMQTAHAMAPVTAILPNDKARMSSVVERLTVSDRITVSVME